MAARRRKRLLVRLPLLAVLAVLTFWTQWTPDESDSLEDPRDGRAPALTLELGSPELREAYVRQESGLVIEFAARVERLLSDDNDGSRHQRFVVRVAEGHTILISHNIDLAARVDVAVGDTVEVRGQYEWNDEGGVVHWTHHDPSGDRPGGWIRHRGVTVR